jgi:cation transport ATPase
LTVAIKAAEVLDELEGHLRDDAEQQMRSGSNPQQAFEVAVQRIGQAHALKSEFAKVGGTKGARRWRLVGIVHSALASLFSLAMLLGLFAWSGVSVAARLFGSAAVAVTVLSFFGWRYSHRFLPVIRNQRVRMVVEIACSLSGAVWMALFSTLVVAHFFDTCDRVDVRHVVQFAIVYLWAMTLMAILGGVAYGLEEAAGRQTATANS